jgi:hypothetical protein
MYKQLPRDERQNQIYMDSTKFLPTS